MVRNRRYGRERMSTYETASAVPRPVAFQGDLRKLPDALKPLTEMPNWVCWKWQWKINKRRGGKWDKPPFRPGNPRQYAKNNDPSTWGTYPEALAAFEAGQCDGIGFNLSGTAIAAFDIDKCRDRETGSIAPEAMALVDRAASYTEMTVSGTGLRVIGFGSGNKVHRRQSLTDSTVEVETYRGAERYIVITGNPLPGGWPHLEDITSEMDSVVAELDSEPADNVFEFKQRASSFESNDAFLPRELVDLIVRGAAPHEDHSGVFHHAVCWLHECGWSAARIESYITGKPIVPERYNGRLAGEIERCLGRAKPQTERTGNTSRSEAPDSESEFQNAKTQPIELLWHGQTMDRAPRAWLVKNLVPEMGSGLLSGQWGTAKTFTGLDLAASIMTATPFAGREVLRRGGILFVAAEGASEIPIRLQGVVDHKLAPLKMSAGAAGNPIDADLDRLPFAWIEECPSLKDGFERLVAASLAAARTIEEEFGLPLAVIIVDTLNAAANFKDGNDAAEGQFIMNRLNDLSRKTGAFVLAVDHFGKAVETGTRGTSAKEAAADMVLALLAERDIAGNISNTRMAVRKLRGGSTGAETFFDLKVVDIGQDETTCIIEWKQGSRPDQKSMDRERWPKSTKILKAALLEVLNNEGKDRDPFGDGKMRVKAAPTASVMSQIIVAHEAALDMYRRAWSQPAEYFEARCRYIQMADKAQRIVALLTERLDRHRGAGQQSITVKHITVNADNAIVGDVSQAPGGGLPGEIEEQPHALGHAIQPTLWSEDPHRQPLSSAGNAERTLSNARRPFSRCTEGQ